MKDIQELDMYQFDSHPDPGQDLTLTEIRIQIQLVIDIMREKK